MTEVNRVSRLVTVHGRVQGVFFRDSCRREAEHHGVTGWVENAPDGTVRALFEGPVDAVDTLVKWSYDGPSHAIVERVDVAETGDQGTSEFRVRG